MEERRAHRVAAFRDAVAERLSRLGVSWIQVESSVAPPNTLPEMLRELHALKGEAAVLGFATATGLIHALEGAVERAESANGDAVLRAFDMLAELFQGEPAAPATDASRALVKELGGQEASAAEPPPSPTRAQPATTPPKEKARREVGMRIAAGQLDRLRDAIGDLFTLRVRLAQLADQLRDVRQGTAQDVGLKKSEAQLRDDAFVLSTLVATLEETVRDMRMVPLSTVLERFPRIVRDLGRDLGKAVNVELDGESAAVDRDVIEALEQALLHLVRNAVDHGIETIERRAQVGKPALGVLRIAAQVAGRHLQVTVSDDGDGIDVAAVRRAAIERGLVDASSDASDDIAMQWIMLPGFTTREHATLVSGRGVGLDAVHTSVQSLGGSLTVTSERGKGTSFKLSIPISTAITSVLLFHVGSGRYALPIGCVEDVVSADEYAFGESLAGVVIDFRGRAIPVVGLGSVVGRPATFTSRPRLIVVRTGFGLVACAGSHGHEHRDVVLRAAGAVLSAREIATAAIALEGGDIALVLNPARLHAESRRTPVAVAAQVTVLVVDDSPIIRDIVAEVLRSHGLVVIEAADGVEALERLSEHPEVGLLVTDIEMPRMNGLELVTRVRELPTRRIPAVVISTRDRDEDKQAAITAGADAYLVKADLTQDSLWSLVGRYVGAA